MGSSYDDLADMIIATVHKILKRTDTPVARAYMGFFVATETVDANLSQVTLVDGSALRFIPKTDAMGALSAGDKLLMVRDVGVPLTIVARVIGDITQAS